MLRIPSWFCALSLVSFSAAAEAVVQIPVGPLLNARAVTTLTEGKLVTWTMGIDGNGGGDGYLTSAASIFHGDKNIKALPDTSLIPADARHPAIQLHWSNSDGTGNQTRALHGADSFTVAVPQGIYSKLFLVFTSSEGSSTLTFTLIYSDGEEKKTIELPDYFNVIAATDANCFNLITDLAKWSKTNGVAENNHHMVDGVELHPAAKTLTAVKVAKTAKAYLVFWGATGITTGTVAARATPLRRQAHGTGKLLRIEGLPSASGESPSVTADGRIGMP